MTGRSRLLSLRSIELRWTLRFSLVMMFVVLGMAYFQYILVAEQIRSDALLLMELQANEVVEAAERSPWSSASRHELIAYVDRHISSAEAELDLGIRLLGPDGRPRLERGSFQRRQIPIPRSFFVGEAPAGLRELEIGADHPFILMAAPLADGWVEVAIHNRRFAESLRDVRRRFLVSLPVALLLTALLSWFLARGSLLPIARMTELARRITTSELDEELPVSGSGDELDRLAQTLNAMIARIRTGVGSLRGFASNAAHQLRTPISRLRIRLETARLSKRDPDADQALIEAALADLERVARVITGMLRLAESDAGLPTGRRHPIELGPLLERVVEFFEPIASDRQIVLIADTACEVRVEGDEEWLTEMFSNLLDNAIKFTPSRGSVSVDLSLHGDQAWIEILDAGCGFSLGRDGERSPAGAFARACAAADTRGSGSALPEHDGPEPGLGLGLPLARKIASAHNGHLSIEPRPEGGARTLVSLPRV